MRWGCGYCDGAEEGQHLYVHIPFCLRICPYCAFFKHTPGAVSMRAFVQALLTEARLRLSADSRLLSLYFGGGTPGMLSPTHLSTLVQGLKQYMDFSHLKEWSFETNPATITPTKARQWADLGITRVSLGAQSFLPTELRFLGRDHSPSQIVDGVRMLRDAGTPQVNLDLMFCLPGQTPDDWRYSLQQAIACEPDHISTYSLTLESGTPFESLSPPSEDTEAELYTMAHELLTSAGFSHYEVSNYARSPATRSLHNLSCWRGEDYVGLGPGACGTLQGLRYANEGNTNTYIDALCNRHTLPPGTSEVLTPVQRLTELIGLGLRTDEGIPLSLIPSTPTSFLQTLADEGLCSLSQNRLILTPRGLLLTDEIASSLLQSIDGGVDGLPAGISEKLSWTRRAEGDIIRSMREEESDDGIYAHHNDDGAWEPLYGAGGHAELTRKVIEAFAPMFAPEVLSAEADVLCRRILAVAHDMGKASKEWQRYLRDSVAGHASHLVDHKKAAAKWAQDTRIPWGIVMAYAFYGHHSGLPNGTDMHDALAKYTICPEVREMMPEELRGKLELPPLDPKSFFRLPQDAPPCIRHAVDGEHAVALAMVVRMLHSCLVDADWTATALFMGELQNCSTPCASMEALSERLEGYLREKERGASGPINELRREIHSACYAAAEEGTGIPPVYRLNVPTGGGKTLSSLSFALRYAVLHGKKRVIYVIPFTSIIEQTAAQFREALGDLGSANVLEHHSNVSEENEENRRASENWDIPIVVTTAVQFFESLFSDQNRRCRKLHNIAQSVIIFDEAQTLPALLLAPCIATIKALQHVFGCTPVLCTATQPAFVRTENFPIGWDAAESRSLIGKELEARLRREMKRVDVVDIGRKHKGDIAEHFLASGAQSALFIVNLTRQARELFAVLKEHRGENLYHLSARMCPAHRSKVLADVCRCLDEGKPTVLVATRVVEAGVDISFPVVYRDRCGLDSLAQSAGRCNRNGELPMGKVFFFRDEEYEISPSMADLREGTYAMSDTLYEYNGDMARVFDDDVVDAYFCKFYARMRGLGNAQNWDEHEVMPLFDGCAWNFPLIAKKFGIIPGGQHNLIIPYGDEGEELRTRLLDLDRLKIMPTREDYRKIQRFSVSVYPQEWDALPKEPVHKAAGLLMLADAAWYDAERGLLREPIDCNYVF